MLYRLSVSLLCTILANNMLLQVNESSVQAILSKKATFTTTTVVRRPVITTYTRPAVYIVPLTYYTPTYVVT